MCVWSKVLYFTYRVCEIMFVFMRLLHSVRLFSIKLICARHTANIVVKHHCGGKKVVLVCVKSHAVRSASLL